MLFPGWADGLTTGDLLPFTHAAEPLPSRGADPQMLPAEKAYEMATIGGAELNPFMHEPAVLL